MKPADVKRLALLMAVNCVRNTVIEDYHAQGKLSNAEMMAFNREVARAPYSCIAYAARSPNHPAISSRVTSCKPDANAAYTAPVVRAATDRTTFLTFENISSIGVRSGLYGGSGTTRAPAASPASLA